MSHQNIVTLRELRRTIGGNIHDIRRKRKVTLETLSKHTNISIKKLDGFEIGKYQLTFEHAILIAAALKINVFQMIQNT